jgi:hypothetical protein
MIAFTMFPSRIVMPILSLLFARGPLAVAGFVVAVVVDALDGVRGAFGRAHIFNEGSERVVPALADRNSSSSVTVKVFEMRVSATVPHRSPRVISGRSDFVCGMTPKRIGGATLATAASALAGLERLSNYIPNRATFANTVPDGFSVAPFGPGAHKPASKFLPDKGRHFAWWSFGHRIPLFVNDKCAVYTIACLS